MDLKSFLDYEIWKISYMLAQEIPGPQHSVADDHGMIDFVTGGDLTDDKIEQFCYDNEVQVEKEK